MNRDQFLEKVLKYPVIFYTLYFLYILRPPLKTIYSKIFVILDDLIMGILLLWGITIVAYNIKKRKNIFSKSSKLFVFLWLLVTLLTLGLNYRYLSFTTIKVSILTFISILIFLPGYNILKEKYESIEIFKKIFYPVFLFKIVINMISIFLYVSNTTIFIIKDKALSLFGLRYVFISDGKYTPLLYGLYDDPNFTALIDSALILTAIYIYVGNNLMMKSIEKTFLFISIVSSFITVSFYNSRGTLYSLIFISIIFGCVFLMKKTENTREFSRILKYVLCSLIILCSYFAIQKVGSTIFKNTDYKKYVILNGKEQIKVLTGNEIKNNKEIEKHGRWLLEYNPIGYETSSSESKKDDVIETTKEDSGSEIGNGRLGIWKEAMELYIKQPVFGISPKAQGIISKEKYSEDEFPTMSKGRSIHNSYISVLLYYGAVGFVILIAWLLKIFVRIYKFEYKNKFTSKSILLYSALFILTSSFFLESIFINNYFEQTYLMFIIGFLISEYKIEN